MIRTLVVQLGRKQCTVVTAVLRHMAVAIKKTGIEAAARLAAAFIRVLARLVGASRRLTTWTHGRVAGIGRSWGSAYGLGAAAVLLVILAVPWVLHVESPLDDLPTIGAGDAGGDIEDLVVVAPPAPPPESLVERTPDPSVHPYLPNEDLVNPPFVVDRSTDSDGKELALLPVRPRAKPHRMRPQWLANAVEPDLRGAGPLIAIVIDDAGVAQERTARAVELPPPLTMAFIPYSENLGRQTRAARTRGHELMLHVPMEPDSVVADPGHNALLTSLDQDEIMRRFRWALDRFDGYVGVNNHMGSKFMARGDLLEPLLALTRERGLLFLDSRTTADTAGTGIARRLGLPNADRDVFLDNELTVENVTAQLAEVERIARKQGHAVAIGHTHDITVETLAKWIPQARARGFTLVPISTVVRLEYGAEHEEELAAAIPAGGEAEGLLGRP